MKRLTSFRKVYRIVDVAMGMGSTRFAHQVPVHEDCQRLPVTQKEGVMNFRTIFLGVVVLTCISCLTAPAAVITLLEEDFNDDDAAGTQLLAGNTANSGQVWPAGEQRGGGSERFTTGSAYSLDGTVGAGIGASNTAGNQSIRNNLTFGSGFSRQRAIDDGGGTYTVMIDMYRNAAREVGVELRSPGASKIFTLGWGGSAPGMGGSQNLYGIELSPGGAAPDALTLKLEMVVDANGDHTGTYSYAGVVDPTHTYSRTGSSSNDFEYDTIRIQMNGGNGVDVTGGYDNIRITYEPVPEPATAAMLAIGLGVLALCRSRRR